jgi:medium-chain acyl-[acyl-carrier-protein] hydrolase
MSLLSPMLHADLELAKTYRHRAEAPLDIPLEVFAGLSDETVGEAELAAWSEQATSTNVRRFPGYHSYLLAESKRVFETVARLTRIV